MDCYASNTNNHSNGKYKGRAASFWCQFCCSRPQPPVQVQKWGQGADKTKRGGLRPPRIPKQPGTPFGTLPQQVLHAPVLQQTKNSLPGEGSGCSTSNLTVHNQRNFLLCGLPSPKDGDCDHLSDQGISKWQHSTLITRSMGTFPLSILTCSFPFFVFLMYFLHDICKNYWIKHQHPFPCN